MREKNYNAGLRGVLFEARHYQRMGSAIWLFGWLVLRQTHQSGSVGWVLGGTPVTYREIEEETGFNKRTLERWMQTLRRHGYIDTEAAQGGVIIRIAKAKKFAQPGRKSAEGGRKSAARSPQFGGAAQHDSFSSQSIPAPIGSSYVGDKFINRNPSCSVENQPQNQTHTHNKSDSRRNSGNAESFRTEAGNRTPSREEWEARRKWRLLRAERDDAVRRELAVGAGPEVARR